MRQTTMPSNHSRALKVLHIYQDFYPKRGGIEDHILTLCQASPGRIRSQVLTSHRAWRTRRETIQGMPVIRSAAWGRYYTPFCPMMPLEIRRAACHLIHLHLPCPMAVVATLLAQTQTPLIIGYHNDIVQQRLLLKLYSPFLQAILQRARYILVSTQAYLDSSTRLAAFRNKCIVIPYGIDLNRFTTTSSILNQTQAIRAAYPGSVVLFVGRLCYYKGLEYLIPAMADVPATLLIVGTGPLEIGLRRLVEDYGLTGRIHFVGAVTDPELTAYYQASDLVVLPSTYRSEAFGLVQLQAQACQRPVISTDLAGVSTVNRHGQTGLIVPPRSTTALAEAINHLLANESLRRQLGQAGRQQVEASYQATLMALRIGEVYEKAIQS